jgi:hypothetical protein
MSGAEPGARAPLKEPEKKAQDAHRRRAQAAWSQRDQWNRELYDVYDFVAPTRLSTRMQSRAPGARINRMFDSTAMVSMFRFAKRVQKEFFAGEWFKLKPGAFYDAQAPDIKDQAAAQAEQVTKLVSHVFTSPEWAVALKETLLDTFISTCFLFILDGDADRPVRFVTASLDECAIDLGPYRDISGVFFKRKWTYRAISEEWPHGDFDDQMRQKIENSPEEETLLCQDVVYDAKAKRWRLKVYLEDCGQGYIHEEDSLTKPVATPRLMTLPGQAYGFGLAMLALATIKTTNKAVELQLRAAALAMAGIFTRVDDGVFNPDTARVEPGAFWTVARNGGTLGPSIQKLAPPGDLNLGNLVLSDLRQQIQTVSEDRQLPPENVSPRSAIEIAERIKQVQNDQTGDEVLLAEIGIPVVNRVLEILHNKRLLPHPVKIDGMFLTMELASPAALAAKASPVQAVVSWLQMMQQLDPSMIHFETDLGQTFAELGSWIGVPAHLIASTADRLKSQAAAAQVVAAQQQAQAAAQAPPPVPNGNPAQAGSPGAQRLQ